MSSKHHHLSARTRARLRAADTLFEAEIKGFGSDPDGLRGLAAKRKVVSTRQTGLPAYAEQVVLGVADHIDAINDALATHSHEWALDRMPATDLVAMRIGAWEILFNDDVPDTVAISEAIAIVRLIGTDKAPAFVNGLLDAIRKDKYTDDDAS